jgi:hypothetical protein
MRVIVSVGKIILGLDNAHDRKGIVPDGHRGFFHTHRCSRADPLRRGRRTKVGDTSSLIPSSRPGLFLVSSEGLRESAGSRTIYGDLTESISHM